jgi:hypothetical protein
MAYTTQYIGSRYVPIFADPAEWNSTRTYEPLTIVLNEGNSYTSRQFVPVGVAITNTEYWLETGNYNAQVEQYRNEAINSMKAYSTASNMVTDTHLTIGKIVHTSGYNSIGDNGAAYYIISANAADVLAIRLDNGCYANYVFGKTMNAAQFPYALNNDIYSLFMKSNASVLDLNKQTLTAPCTNGSPRTDKTIKNGNITVSEYMFSFSNKTFKGSLVLENLNIQCSMSSPKIFTFSCPPNTDEFHVRNCHVYSNSPTAGWCPFYTIANTLEFTGNYIDASNIPDNTEGGCIWVLSYEDNSARNTITIENNHLIANGVDEVLGIRNNNFSYIVIANNLIEGINAQRNYIVTLTETTHTSNHGIIFFHDNTIDGSVIDVQIEIDTLAICRNNYHPTGSYGLMATSDGREPSIDNELVNSVKVRNAMTLHNCLISGYVNVNSDDVTFVGGMIGNIYPRETNAQFINCILTGMPNNLSNCYSLDTSKAPVCNLDVNNRVLHWENVNSNKPFYFQTNPSPESFISTDTDVSKNYSIVNYATDMNQLPNCMFTISAPHLQGHKNAS